jgi:hypothetical protein
MALLALTVRPSKQNDVYKDVARIPEAYRRTAEGRPIREGTICDICTENGKVTVALRGLVDEPSPVIRIDDKTRNELGVVVGVNYGFDLRPVGLWGNVRWRWNASEPHQQMTNRISLIAISLAVGGLVWALAKKLLLLLRLL